MGLWRFFGSCAARAARPAAITLVAAGVFACGAAAMPGCSSSDSGAVASPCPPGQTCQTRLTLLHTSDIHSRLLPYDLLVTQVDGDLGLGSTGNVKNVGGVARMAYILGRERARANRVLHLDSGDCFQGAPIFNFYSGEPEVRAVSLLGTDAQVIGNHEFDRGAINVARQYQRWATFPLLAANYKFDDARIPGSTLIGSVISPFTVFNQGGLKIAVIGMGNISTITSVFDQPNKVGVSPLNTIETAQGYIDALRPYVDVIVMLTHLGLQVDQAMIRGTTGIDAVLGGHNHVVINPPQQLEDCSADPEHPGYIWTPRPDITADPANPVFDPRDRYQQHPNDAPRPCTPRKVVLAHSGAFAKYVGRLDLILSNDPADTPGYDPVNGFEIVSSQYVAYPIDDAVPDDPVTLDMLQPYRRTLDRVADLDILVGFSPQGAKRSAPQGGDAPLGNLVATAAWLRLGVQTDFSLTNTTGIRADLNPGPITIEQMYNIFPFDNSITKMQISGLEVQQLFDYVARRSASRGCVSQAQIAGARVRLNCAGCARKDHVFGCSVDSDCPTGTPSACDTATQGPAGSVFLHTCAPQPCAEEVYIGQTGKACDADAECVDADGTQHAGQCFKAVLDRPGVCQAVIAPTNLYELATSNYLAAGGSGYRVLQRNTTQFDTLIQQRDALVDYLRQGKPCGWAAPDLHPDRQSDGLLACSTDADCGEDDAYVCACAGGSQQDESAGTTTCTQSGQCDLAQGRCVLRDCRDQVAEFHLGVCAGSPNAARCKVDLNACSLAGEECKFLSCVDKNVGSATDDRLEMLGR
jgi:5'-nucleotidase / UDP-sugar diphosphatase